MTHAGGRVDHRDQRHQLIWHDCQQALPDERFTVGTVALQRDFSGHVALSPLFDFAPMFLHPDGIGRRMRWADGDAGSPDWSRVLDAVGRDPVLDRAALCDGLRQMAPALASIAREGVALGLSSAVHALLRPGIESLARQLDGLR